MFKISYTKNNNKKLFTNFEEQGIYNIQNYIPIYSRFLLLNEKNYNSVNLNNNFHISSINKEINNNVFEITVKDGNKDEYLKESFFKFCPLLDPVKYMVGKYKKISCDKMKELPKLKDAKCSKKVSDSNNSAYTDSFFSFLSSTLLNHYNFWNGIDYYGSYLGIQSNHKINIIDDLEYLYDSNFFHKNLDKLFETEDIDEELLEADTRSNRKKLVLNNENIKLKTEKIDTTEFK